MVSILERPEPMVKENENENDYQNIIDYILDFICDCLHILSLYDQYS